MYNICANLLGNAPLEGVDLDIDFSLRQIYSSDARCLAPVSHFRLFEVFAYGWLRVKIQDEAGVQVRRRIRQWDKATVQRLWVCMWRI